MALFVDSVKVLQYYGSMFIDRPKRLFKNLLGLFRGRRIYLDYASLTPIDPRVSREMRRFEIPEYANPSSLYREGVAAKKVLAAARKSVADHIHAHPDEIIFTSGGTEANVLALEGVARAARAGGIEMPHVIISSIEHSSIIEVARMMEQHGCEVTRLAVNEVGIISPEELKKAIKENTIMVSIMTVNNEIGTIQPIREIAKIVRQARKEFHSSVSDNQFADVPHFAYPLFHTDAAQAVLYEELFVEKLGVDLMTLDGGKIYGPRGVGCLYVRRNTPIEPIIYGGGQEAGMRSGTENIPGIMGFAKALEIAESVRSSEVERLNGLRTMMMKGLKKIRPDISVNGDESMDMGGNRLSVAENAPHILNVSIPGIDNEFFVLQLDAKGIACSTKSSCLRDEDESYVLRAIGATSGNSVRFSFGRWTKRGDVERTLKVISAILIK